MKTNFKNFWEKTETFRSSMPNMIMKGFSDFYSDPAFPKESFCQRINRSLMKYKEIKLISKKTHIPPIYFMIVILICLTFIIVGYFDNYLTIVLGTLYPLYTSFKTLQFRIGKEKPDGRIYSEEDEKNDTIQWLSYWVVYSLFNLIESIFGKWMKKIPLYFFIKMIFLLLCFLPQYKLAWYIYYHIIRPIFNKYEDTIVKVSEDILNKLTKDKDNNNGLKKAKKINQTISQDLAALLSNIKK